MGSIRGVSSGETLRQAHIKVVLKLQSQALDAALLLSNSFLHLNPPLRKTTQTVIFYYFTLSTRTGDEIDPEEADIVGVDIDDDKAPFMVIFFRSSTEGISPHIRKKRGSQGRRSRSRSSKSSRKKSGSSSESRNHRQAAGLFYIYINYIF